MIKYAQHIGATREQLYRALVLSNLIAIHQKTGLGRLSAYCGAVSAAVGSGAAITYLYGGSYEAVCDTITNTIANVSGIVCDGAKPSWRGQNCLRSGCGDPRPLHGAAKPQLPARRRNCPRRCGGYHPGRWPDWARWNARNGRGNFEYYSGED